MKTIYAVIVMLVVFVGAQAPNRSGLYRSKNGEARIRDGGGAAGRSLTFKLGVGFPGCGGGVEGDAKWVKTGEVAEYDEKGAEQGAECHLTFTFAGNRLQIEEGQCGYFHGAACDFTGTYIRKAAR